MESEIKATFGTRREAELAVEHLVQEYELNRTDIFLQPEGADNTAGAAPSGADVQGSLSEPRDQGQAKIAGRIAMSVGCDSDKADAVRKAIEDAGGKLG